MKYNVAFYPTNIIFFSFIRIMLEANNIKLDASEAPHLAKWGEDVKALIIRWYPRIRNLIPTKGVNSPRKITLKICKSDKFIGGTSGTTIIVSSRWIEKYPDDIGLVFHEIE